jgi:azurin/glucose/arabinose dehydrogenase
MKQHLTFLLAMAAAVAPASAQLELHKGDNVAIIGSGLADRQQHHAWLEALIHKAYPDLELTIRNLGFAADEVNVHPRSDEVPTTEYFLGLKKGDVTVKAGGTDVTYKAGTDFNANVILAYWGFNESFKGEAGLEDFKKALDAHLKKHLGADYGKGHPRIVLLSPIAHENLKDPVNYPDGSANNRNLELYTKAMAEVAKANKVPFVDLFHPSQELYAQSSHPLTINGIHLTEEGDKALAPVQFKGIFGKDAPAADQPSVEKIRQAVLEKNVQWHHRYRTVDQYNIYGQRSRIKYEGVDNATILGEEMAQRDVKVANRDRAVWAAAQGRDYVVKDDNLPPVDLTPPNRPEPVPYLDGAEAVKYIKVPEGCKVEFIASEKEFPELINPVQMNFDTRGRLWISAWPTYPETMPTTTNYDKLLVFEIDPKTGKFTKCTTFADGLNCATGFQLYKDGVLVMQSPDMWFMRDTNGDGKADWKERIVHGLDAADSHHETNSICYEPGGAVYFSDGVFHRTNVETLGGPVRNENGAIYRFEPRTSRFERYVPYAFANPHGRVFDYWGNDIITDATGNANYFGPGFSGHLDSGAHPKMEQFWQRPSRPCPGTNILSSRHFPDDWQGQFLNTNVISFQGIFRARVTEEGSGLKGETIEPLVEGDIKSNPNFRPSGVAVAPDGSLYFMDWSQMLIGHLQHHLRDPNRDHQHGRIYRITFPARPLLEPKKIAGQSIEHLLELLKEHEDNVRTRAKIELDTHDTKQVIAAVQKWEKALDKSDMDYEHHRLEALWVHQWHNIVNGDLLNAVLKSPEPRARAQAVRVLCYWRDRIPNALDLLEVAINDSAPRVRLEAIRALSFFSGADGGRAQDIAFELEKQPMDYYLDYCFKETMRQLLTLVLPKDPVKLEAVIAKMSAEELKERKASEPILLARLDRREYDAAYRAQVVSDLAALRKTDKVTELIAAFNRLDAKSNDAAAAELTKVLVGLPAADLAKARPALLKLALEGKRAPVRKAGWAGVVLGDGKVDAAWAAAKDRESLVGAIPVIPDAALRAQFQGKLAELAPQASGGTLKAVLAALPLMGSANAGANFGILAKNLISGKERNTAAAAIMALPRDSWDKADAPAIAQSVLAHAKTLKEEQRKRQDFLELNQLAMDMAALAGDAALRKELRSLAVPIFVVKTVHEQMRYDTPRIVTEAGKPFEIILDNADVMPHNLVVVDPGQHLAVSTAAMTMTINDVDKKDKRKRQFLPQGQKIYEATKLVEPGQKESIKLDAPRKEGAYEYVCTFPGHGILMWGVLVVTRDVDEYLARNPTFTLPPPGAPVPAAK